MLIYNSKEMKTHYMRTDEVVVEINSLLPVEELVDKLRNGEEISEDMASIIAFKINDGAVITQAEETKKSEEKDAEVSTGTGTRTTKKRSYSYDSLIDRNEMEDEEAEERPKMFQAYEAFQFNRPWKAYQFVKTEITKEQLLTQLLSALKIMPTVSDIPDKSLEELKQMSGYGDRLYWKFNEINEFNKLPSREDIEFYASLDTYEKKLINETRCHPMKMLNIAKNIKNNDSGRLLTKNDEMMATNHSEEFVSTVSKDAAASFYYNSLVPAYQDEKMVALEGWMFSEFGDAGKPMAMQFNSDMKAKLNEKATFENLITLRSKTADGTDNEEKQKQELSRFEFSVFANEMFEGKVVPQEMLNEWASNKNTSDTYSFCEKLYKYYKSAFADFKEQISKDGLGTSYDEGIMDRYILSLYKKPVSFVMQKADAVFKELFKGHSPRVLSEYMFAKFYEMNKAPRNVDDTTIRTIAEGFNQKNVAKIAKYKNPVLFALSDKLNYNEIRAEHLMILASYIKPKDMAELFRKDFVKWYIAHKDTNPSDLVELLEVYPRIKRFDVSKSAKELVFSINNEKGIADCREMERKYGYQFSNNEIAIKGRHVLAKEGKMRMYMLPKEDYRNFTVGYDTDCCQHYGSAGETCVYKLTTDPFAACVVVERNGKVLAQGFVWTDEEKDTIVFDNVEFADDRKVSQFNDIFAAWAEAVPYKNVHVGIGCNHQMSSWGKRAEFVAKLPTTLYDGRCYSDYRNDARSLKSNGEMQITCRSNVSVSTSPDEPTRWDALANPRTAFFINDSGSTIEQRLEYARMFMENQTPEIQMKAVQLNENSIKNIENPTEDVQKYVIKKNPKLAMYINNPCADVQKILVGNDPFYIKNIQNPDEGMVREALTKNGLLLEYIPNPSEAAVKIAVKQNGYAIRFVENQTEELQIIAVKSNPKVVSLLKNASENVQKAAINADPSVISLIYNPSESLQKFAVEKSPYTINNIEHPSYGAVKKAVEKDSLLIRKFQFQYPHLREVALKNNGYALRVLSNPTEEECVIAVKQNRAVLNLIRNPELRANIVAVLEGRASAAPFEIDFD